jgi:hypothetical protein
MASGDYTEMTAKITVDSQQAEKNVEGLGDALDKTSGAAKSLKAEIRQTTQDLQKLEREGKATGEQFEKLRAKLDDLNDAQERAAFKAGQFDDKLSAMPGVLGQAGGALKTFNDSVNQFGKTLTYSLGIVGIIVTAFIAMKKSLESTAEGQETLNRITTAFQKILGPVMALIESVALPLFEGFANVLGKVADGVGYVVEKLGISKQKIAEASSGVKDFKKQAEELAKDQKAAADKAKAEAEAAAAKAKAAREKAAAEAKAAREKAAAEQAEFEKSQVQAAIELLDGREREQAALAVQYQEQRLKYKDRSAQELLIFDEAYQKKRLDIDAKYDEEAKKKQEEKDKKDLEDAKKVADGKRELSFEQVQDEIAALDKKSLEVEGDFAADITRLEQKKTLLEKQKQIELSNAELTSAQKIKISRDYADKEAAIQKDITATQKAETEARQAINSAYLGLAQQFGNALTQMAGENKELAIAGVVISQAAAIGQIISQTGIANAKAVAASPLTGGMPWVAINTISAGISIASSISQGIKSIQQINAAGGPSVGGGGGGAMSAPSIQAPRVGTAATPVMAEGVGANPSSQIAQTIGQSQNQVVRAYVVSQDITSQQMLDRKSNQAAVF